MKFSVLSDWFGRVGFLAFNVAIASIAFVLVIVPFREMVERERRELQNKNMALTRLQAFADKRTDIEIFARQVKEEAERGEFIAGANEGVVNATLQARLKALAEAAGAEVRSLRALPNRSSSGANFVGARVELAGDIKAIHSTIARIESGSPQLYAPNAIVRLAIGPPAPGQEPKIEAQFDVYGVAQLTGGQ